MLFISPPSGKRLPFITKGAGRAQPWGVVGGGLVLQNRQQAHPPPGHTQQLLSMVSSSTLTLFHRHCPQTRAERETQMDPGRGGGLWGQSLAGQKRGTEGGQSLAVLAGLESEIEGWFASEV